MTRVKKGKIALKRRRNVLAQTKGFRWQRKSKERAAKEALLHAWSRMFRGRKERKRTFRGVWNVKINAAARENGTTYKNLIAGLKAKNIILDRKILALFAEHEPAVFKKVVEAVQA